MAVRRLARPDWSYARPRRPHRGARLFPRIIVVSELRAVSSWHLLPRVLLVLVMLEAGNGQEERAARLLGAFDAAGARVAGWPLEGLRLGPDLATLRARFEHEPFAAAFAAGRTLKVDQALDEALAEAPRWLSSPPLAAREGEVAGKTPSR